MRKMSTSKASTKQESRKQRNDAAATDAERALLTFTGQDIKFDWSNEDWGLAHLSNVRMATLALQKNHLELQQLWTEIVEDGLAPDLLERWCETKHHLNALVTIIDNALTRSFLVLERLGYSPENPPPGDIPA